MILVTGGTGLVGAHLLMSLNNQSIPVRATYRTESSLRKIQSLFQAFDVVPDVEWVKADVTDVEALYTAFENVNEVYHCAAMVSFAKKDKDEMFKINIEGTANVVNCCIEKNVEALCYVSSTAAIGLNKFGEGNEETPWKQSEEISNYSVSKYFAEAEVWRGAEEGLNVCIVNPSIIIGAGDWGKSSSNLFLKVWKGLKFYSTGVNGFVYVNDVVRVMRLLMQERKFGERYLLVGEHLTFQTLFNLIADGLKVKKPTIKVKPWIAEIVWRIEAIRSLLTGKSPLVTKESARSAISTVHYSNDKVTKTFNFNFTPINEAVSETAKVFLSQN